MNAIRQYLIAIAAVSILCGIAKCFSDEKSASGSLIKLICGLIMVLTVVSPVMDLPFSKLPELSDEFLNEGQTASELGEEIALVQTNEIISKQLEAYILDKADSYGAALRVEIQPAKEGDLLLPERIFLYGTVSPYAKVQLQQVISQDLGIAKENLIWIG